MSTTHIFKPLGMEHSSFRQPASPALMKAMATGYKQASDPTPVPYEVVEAAPAGSLESTATDMAKFMIAHLNDGQGESARILKAETARQMHSRNYTLAPGLNGFDLGFYDEDRNGHRIIGHAGDTVAFHSDLHLILDANTGIFMSFNSPGKEGEVGHARTDIFRAFLDRYFPFTPPEEKTVADPSKDNARVVGSYLASRRKESALRLLFQLGQTQVAAAPDGTIMVDAFKDPSGAGQEMARGRSAYLSRSRRPDTPQIRHRCGRQHRPSRDRRFPPSRADPARPWDRADRHAQAVRAGNACRLRAHPGVLVRRLDRAAPFRPAAGDDGATGEAPARRPARRASLYRGRRRMGRTDHGGHHRRDASARRRLNGWIGALYVLGVVAALGGIAMIANGVLRLMRGPGGWLVRTGDAVLALAGLYGIWAIYDYGLANFQFNI